MTNYMCSYEYTRSLCIYITKNVMKSYSQTCFVFQVTAIYKYCSMNHASERAPHTFMRIFGSLTAVYFLDFQNVKVYTRVCSAFLCTLGSLSVPQKSVLPSI